MGVFDSIVVNLSVLATPQKAEFLRRFCVVSDGKSTIAEGTCEMVTADNWKTKVTGTDEVSKALTSFFVNAVGKVAYVFECGTSGTADAKLKKLEAFIDGATLPCYEYLLPEALYKDTYLATMLTKYSKEETPTYFSANLVIAGQSDPTQQTEYNNWKGKKAFMGVYPTISDANFNTAGMILGVKASSVFDISTAKKMSSLEYKYCGSASNTLDTATLTKIGQAPCVFTMLKSIKNEIRNTKMADGKFWHYRYAQDTLVSMLQANIDALFSNASNTTNGALQYNDAGIQSIKQNIISTLTTAKQMGIVNRYAQSIDLATNQLTGIDDIASIPFEEYKNANPTHYADGLYGGYSGYIEIMNFIVKIEFNVTLG